MEYLTDFDAAAYLDNETVRAYYLAEVAKEHDANAMRNATITVARSREITHEQVSETGQSDKVTFSQIADNLALC